MFILSRRSRSLETGDRSDFGVLDWQMWATLRGVCIDVVVWALRSIHRNLWGDQGEWEQRGRVAWNGPAAQRIDGKLSTEPSSYPQKTRSYPQNRVPNA
jgi:hypothetical protein